MSFKLLSPLIIGSTIALLLGIIVFNFITHPSYQITPKYEDTKSPKPYNRVDAFKRLKGAIQIKTISYDDKNKIDYQTYLDLIDYIEKTYPLVTQHLERVVINEYSLLYIWKSKNYKTKHDHPFALLAHTDVVPVPENTLKKWSVDPFAGEIHDGYLYGRGTIDDKGNVFAILEALEWHLKEEHMPENTIYISFGHDEEIGGKDGNRHVAEYIKKDLGDKKLSYLLDEGMILAAGGFVKGIDEKALVACIAISEKGYATFELSVNHKGGHASMPPRESAIDILSRALTRINDSPPPVRVTNESPFMKFLTYIASEQSMLWKICTTNLWLFKPLLKYAVLYDNVLSSNIKTTVATTMIQGGVKSNVLPTFVKATINSRIIPGESVKSTLNHLQTVVNDERVNITVISSIEPAPISSTDSDGYDVIRKSIKQVYHDREIYDAPVLMIANTDTRWYWDLSDQLYRFNAFPFYLEDIPRIHGINERIHIDSYDNLIEFFYRVISNSDSVDD
eukprot:TRINITY_DN126_c3_g1_i1.p1 TRINITY_DN126_c3_g1~~TRINITY_DN126_c3_g1_i1.p1  ORF type:complete len:507 (-),score=128.15 TRINITY_DN126_c3_g1_i1:38-1558(-)